MKEENALSEEFKRRVDIIDAQFVEELFNNVLEKKDRMTPEPKVHYQVMRFPPFIYDGYVTITLLCGRNFSTLLSKNVKGLVTCLNCKKQLK